MNNCNYIPQPIALEDFNGDWHLYLNAIYEVFKQDFLTSPVVFNNKIVSIITEAIFDGKERSFWHIISDEHKGTPKCDKNRIPNLERCSKIVWVKPLITDLNSCKHYKVWVQFHDKTNRNRYFIWCTNIDYLVILEDRKSFFKLITAYPVRKSKKVQLNNHYEQYIKTKTPV